MSQPVTFWFEFASTYSYLSAMRIEAEAAKRDVQVEWKPFLLGPIFTKQGWNTSPFNIYPAKGRYMWRDMARQCERYGLDLHPGFAAGEVQFPQHSVRAARTALAVQNEAWASEFCREVFRAQFGDGQDISSPDVLSHCLERCGGDAPRYLPIANSDEIKNQLRAHVDEAEQRGLFGAPSFTIGSEVFWGDDRLEDALEFAST